MTRFNFDTPVDYNEPAKQRFHSAARRQLRALAAALALPAGSFDIRSNKAGIAVSGEVTLHGEHLYVQAGQGSGLGLLFRSCQGRKDYSGGLNHWTPLDKLNEPERLADLIRQQVR